MGDVTDWQNLQRRCVENGAFAVLRVETFNQGNEQRYALSACERKVDGKMLNELRATSTDNAPQHVVTQLVTQALAEWWS